MWQYWTCILEFTYYLHVAMLQCCMSYFSEYWMLGNS
uniref:Uncharacterized protein n=1 Tax=Rhizophora mucronata TaxID=61149 RepID=A0A2P2NPZ0_RHIMU